MIRLQIFFLLLELWRVGEWNLASPKALVWVWVLVSQAIYGKGVWTDSTDATSSFIVPKKLKVLCHQVFCFKMTYIFHRFNFLRDILLLLITDLNAVVSRWKMAHIFLFRQTAPICERSKILQVKSYVHMVKHFKMSFEYLKISGTNIFVFKIP